MGDTKFKANAQLTPSEQLISNVPDTGSTKIGADDSFAVLACDGVFDVLSDDEVAALVRNRLGAGDTPNEVLAALIKEALERDTKDNMTVALIVF